MLVRCNHLPTALVICSAITGAIEAQEPASSRSARSEPERDLFQYQDAQVAVHGFVDRTFPPFTARDSLTGKRISLTDLRGHAVLIHFWATGSEASLDNLSQVRAAYERFQRQSLIVLSICLSGDKTEFRRCVRQFKMNWLNVLDERAAESPFVKALAIDCDALPYMFLLDTHGIGQAFGSARAGGYRIAVAPDDVLHAFMRRRPGCWLPDNLIPVIEYSILEGPEAKIAEADRLLGAQDFVKALELYGRIAAEHPNGVQGKRAAAMVAQLNADPRVIEAQKKRKASPRLQAEAAEKAPGLLKMARSLAAAGKPEGARRFYEKVLREYPGTVHAQTAETEMKALGQEP